MKTLIVGLMFAMIGAAQLIDAGSAADRNFTGGAVWDRSTPGYEDLGAAPYTDLRYGASFTYKIPVAPGFYRVRAYLMENRSTNIAAGQRVFTISVNGQASAPIDVFAAVGSKQPYTLDLFAVNNSGMITVAVTATKGNAVVSALEVAPMALTDLESGAITGDSVKLKSGKYLDVFETTNQQFKTQLAAAIEPARRVPLQAVAANRFGYQGPMIPVIGPDDRLRTAMMSNGTILVQMTDLGVPAVPDVIAFGFPNMYFSERLTWTAGERWIFKVRPNPGNSLAVYKNGVKLTQDAFGLSWTDPNQLPDAVTVPGTLPNDIILADYVAGGIPPLPR